MQLMQALPRLAKPDRVPDRPPTQLRFASKQKRIDPGSMRFCFVVLQTAVARYASS